MSPEQRQQDLISRFLPIEDVQERMALVVDRVRKRPPLPEHERTEENRVQGCSSRVWIVSECADGLCKFRVDADSTLVRGLAAIVCDVYEGTAPAEAAAFETTVLEALHLTDHLSPTRRNGLDQVRRTVRELAARAGGANGA